MAIEKLEKYVIVRVTESEKLKLDKVADQRSKTPSIMLREYIKRLRVK